MASGDRQFQPLGNVSTPASWTLQGSLEIVPKCVRAVFDGTGAGGAFLPTLQIISDSGNVVGEVATDTVVAAGGSADVTWAPFLKAAAAAAATGPACPFAVAIRYTQTLADNANTTINLTTSSGTADFATSDSAIFDLDSSSGNGRMRVKVPGTYLWVAFAHLGPIVGPPAADAIATVSLGSDLLEGTAVASGAWWKQVGLATYIARPIYSGFASWSVAAGGTPTSEPFVVGQRSGGSVTANCGVCVTQLSTIGLF